MQAVPEAAGKSPSAAQHRLLECLGIPHEDTLHARPTPSSGIAA
jgi:hypothetical protein